MVDVNAIQELLDKNFEIKGTIHIDPNSGTVDVEGHAMLEKKIKQMPVQFGTVTGSFTCTENRLESLVGSPHTVGKDFSCGHNRLTSLEGGPTHVGGGFWCSDNQLTSLVGAPDHVGRSLQVNGNPLRSLDGMPVELKGQIWLDYDRDLPLLNLIELKAGFMLSYAPDKVKAILKSYAPTKSILSVIDCGVALKDAGYAANAQM
jgi:hypothetical protein